MTVITLRFLAGAYRANPWGRHVNEGIVEWPPSPFRLARALVDSAFRRFSDWPPERVAQAVETLAGHPRFFLPQASASHIRLFMSSNKEEASKRQRIVDAFASVRRDEPVLMELDPNAPQDGAVLADLSTLLESLNYLGRSESWVEAKIDTETQPTNRNCGPVDSPFQIAQSNQEKVQVACLRPRESYEALSPKPMLGKGKKARPRSWLEAICMGSKDIYAEGWSHHPALLPLDYLRPANGLCPMGVASKEQISIPFRFARFALTSSVLPRIETTLVLAERIRRHLMGINRRIENGDSKAISPLFSGKDSAGNAATGHRHAFLVPKDDDQDGRLDHLEVWGTDSFSMTEIQVLDGLKSIWQEGGRPDIEFLLTDLLDSRPVVSSRSWSALLPLLPLVTTDEGEGISSSG